VSPDGQAVAVGGDPEKDGPGELLVFDRGGDALPRRIGAPERAVTAVAFSPDGSLVATAVPPFSVQIWEVRTGRLRGRMVAQDVRALAFSPDGRLLAEGHTAPPPPQPPPENELAGALRWLVGGVRRATPEATTVTLWDTTVWQPRMMFAGPSRPISAVAFTPDGRTLAAANSEGTVLLTPVPFVQWAAAVPPPAMAMPPDRVVIDGNPPRVIQGALPGARVITGNDAPVGARPAVPASFGADTPGPKGWIPVVEFFGLLVTLSLGLGVWLVVRRRRPAEEAVEADEIIEEALPDEPEPLPPPPPPPPTKLSFPCPACGKKLDAPRALAGKKARCPKCSKVVAVPSLQTAPDTPPA
jgi:hypothetical protein